MPAGRPVKYSNPEEMQSIIDFYFDDCAYNRSIEKVLPGETTEVSTPDLHPTITGLALSLDMTRKGLIDYENKDNPEFGNTIKKAKSRVESYVEQRLFYNNPTGCIFNLKNNFNWKDQQEHKIDAIVELKTITRKIVKAPA